MREILFKAQRRDNKKWVISDCIFQCNGIIKLWDAQSNDGWVEVIPETVRQYTCLTDINGKKIFEGDIVRIKYKETTIEKAVIEYAGFGFYGATIGDYWELENYYEIEVIGNRWDNPELLGQDKCN